MNKKQTLTILGALIILLSVVTVTYGYITANVASQNQQVSVQAGTMELTFADNDNGIAAVLNFGDTITKKFTIENTGTLDAYAKISWLNLINTYLEGSLIYTLEYSTSENGTYTEIVTDKNVPRSATASTVELANGIEVPANTKLYYNLKITLVNSEAVDQTADLTASFNTLFTMESGSKPTIAITYSDYIPDFGTDTSNANNPKLVENLIPVIYDESNDQWIKASTTQSGWYNYDTQIWANAVTTTKETRFSYQKAEPGAIIPMEDILGMYVWIPRYEYQYTNLGTSYAGGTKELPGGIGINFVSGTSTTETANYIIHPAFRNGSVNYTNNAYTPTTPYQMGGWDSEITGFWYAKFETTGSATEPTSKPNEQSLREQAVGEQFATSQLISSYQGINMDSHMSKNSEWGAVSYLSQSAYGKYGNSAYTGANKEIYINNSSGDYTGRSMGLPAGATGYTSPSEGTYKYNDTQNGAEKNGVGASTTGNIYGVYDMVGGAYEHVMGNYNKKVASSSLTFPNSKYYDLYTTTTATTACGGKICYGHGLSETSGWYYDHIYMISSDSPWFLRGANYYRYNFSDAGVWSSSSSIGSANLYNGFRAVLI